MSFVDAKMALEGFGKVLTRSRTVRSDSWAFRLNYVGTLWVGLILGALVGGHQYLGEAMICTTGTAIKSELVRSHCWSTTTYLVPSRWNGTIHKDFGARGVGPAAEGEEVKEVGYYKWIAFAFLLVAVTSYITRIIWKRAERGLLKDAIQDLHQATQEEDQRDLQITHLARALTTDRNAWGRLGLAQLTLAFLNPAVVGLQAYGLNILLDGEFTWYGPQALGWMEAPRVDQHLWVFPTMARCDYSQWGASATVGGFDAICQLSHNYLNAKLFIFLWFWLCLVAVANCIASVSLLICAIFKKCRTDCIYAMVNDEDTDFKLKDVREIVDVEGLDWLQKFGYWYALRTVCAHMSTLKVGKLLEALKPAWDAATLKRRV